MPRFIFTLAISSVSSLSFRTCLMILFLLFEGNGCLNHNLVFISSRVLEPAALLHVRRVLVPEVPDLPGGVLWAGALEHLGVGADPLVGYPLAPWGKKTKTHYIYNLRENRGNMV